MRHLLSISLLFLPTPQVARATALTAQASKPCSLDSLPSAQRRRLVDGYVQRHKTQGKKSADAWARAQEESLYQQLVAQGACPATRMTRTPASRQQTRGARGAGKKILNRQGKPCRNITVENQLVPGFGGEPMRLVLVQVCKD